MKNVQLILFILILLLNSICGLSQKPNTEWQSNEGDVTFISGEPSRLKGIVSFTAVMKAENLKLGMKGDADSIYIKRKVKELNAKDPGRGDDFKKEWSTTTSYFLPAFIDGFNAKASELNNPHIDTSNFNSQSEYLMVLYPDLLYYKTVTPKLTMHMDIVSKKNQKDTIAKFAFLTLGTRIGNKLYTDYNPDAFYKAGHTLARYFKKFIYKSK